MTIEQLMIPRVMCIGTEAGKPIWPRSIYKAGDVVEIPNDRQKYIFCDTDGPTYYDFPHLFRPMPWYEGRKPEEMPEYVKTRLGDVYKVTYDFETNAKYWMFIDGSIHPYNPDDFIPSTLEEYITYKGYRKCPDCNSIWGGNERCPECNPMG